MILISSLGNVETLSRKESEKITESGSSADESDGENDDPSVITVSPTSVCVRACGCMGVCVCGHAGPCVCRRVGMPCNKRLLLLRVDLQQNGVIHFPSIGKFLKVEFGLCYTFHSFSRDFPYKIMLHLHVCFH